MLPANSRHELFALAMVLTLSSCTKVKDFLGLNEEPIKPKSRLEESPAPPPDVGDGAGPPEPLTRAERKLRFPGKSSEHLGFDLDKLSQVTALAGAIEVPEWSDPGHGGPRQVRDDDLRTSWSCHPGPERACAIGIHFPQPAAATAVRLFVDSSTRSPHTRPQRVRVHTDDGWAEAKLPDEDGVWHVLLGEPVLTRNLSVEWIETYADAPVHLAEIEVFGREGVPRPALDLDLARHVVSFDPPLWSKKSRTYSAGGSYIERVDVDGNLERLLPGTALIGKTGDRLLLLERAESSTCGDHQGSYSLLDTQTRVLVPLGNMAGFPSHTYRHHTGLGFAMGHIEGDEPELVGIVYDDDHYERRSTTRLERRDPQARLNEWGIDDTSLRRGEGHPTSAPPAGCGPARLETLDALKPHLPARTSIVATHWVGCSLGGSSRLLVSTSGSCGKRWIVAVLDTEDGSLVGMQSGKESGLQLRLRRLDPETILVEPWGNKDAPSLLQADSGTLARIEGSAGFSLRPPAGCRRRCDLEFADLVEK